MSRHNVLERWVTREYVTDYADDDEDARYQIHCTAVLPVKDNEASTASVLNTLRTIIHHSILCERSQDRLDRCFSVVGHRTPLAYPGVKKQRIIGLTVTGACVCPATRMWDIEGMAPNGVRQLPRAGPFRFWR